MERNAAAGSQSFIGLYTAWRKEEGHEMEKKRYNRFLFCLPVVLAAITLGPVLLYGQRAQDPGPDTAPLTPGIAEKAPPAQVREGFEEKKVGSRYEPVPDDDFLVFRLPGTRMTFATYAYHMPGDDMPFPKYGFLFDDGRLFYVDEVGASDGDAHYALSDGYFVVDGFAHDSTGHDRSMYLFRYGKDSVSLLDIIGGEFATRYRFEFRSNYPGKPAYGHEITLESTDTPVWVIKDRDSRGNPLIRVKLYHDPFVSALYDFYKKKGLDPNEFEELHLYVKIVTPEAGGAPAQRVARLQVALDHEIYKPLFDRVRQVRKAGIRPVGYYVYGFLAGQIDLAHIKAELADNKLRRYVVDMLEGAGSWDAVAHYRLGTPMPEMAEYELERR